jgi:hypothetical protein
VNRAAAAAGTKPEAEQGPQSETGTA